MNINFPAVTDADKPYLWQLYRQAMKSHIEKIWGWDESWQGADFEEKLNLHNTLLVVSDSNRVGYLQFSVNESNTYINMLILDARYRSRGLGRAVMLNIISLDPGKAIELRCFKVNTKAYDFYLKFGFVVIETEDKSFLMRYDTRPNLLASPHAPT